jgi:SAM-dependent methyltransferase
MGITANTTPPNARGRESQTPPAISDSAAGRFHWARQYEYAPAEYERRSRRYSWNYRFLLELPRSSKVLEIGCGGGFFLHFLQQAGFLDCTGLDVDPAAIEACRRNVTERAFCMQAQSFFRESRMQFDLIVSNHVVEHMSRAHAVKLLSELRESLAPGGAICVATPNAMSPWAGFHLYNDPTHCRLYTPETLDELLLEAGFANITIRGEGPAPYDALTTVRYVLWKIRRLWLSFLFAVDVGVGRNKRVKLFFEQGLIADGTRGD